MLVKGSDFTTGSTKADIFTLLCNFAQVKLLYIDSYLVRLCASLI